VNRANVFPLLAAAALFAGCSSLEVRSAAEPDFDFTTLHTFAVRPIDPAVENIPELGPLALEQIETQVAESFRARGFTAAPRGEADFILVIHPNVHDKVDVVSYGYAPGTVGYWAGYGGPYRGGVGGTQAFEYREGTLVIDAAASGQAVWRGWAQAPMSDKPDAASTRKAIDAITATFPAGTTPEN